MAALGPSYNSSPGHFRNLHPQPQLPRQRARLRRVRKSLRPRVELKLRKVLATSILETSCWTRTERSSCFFILLSVSSAKQEYCSSKLTNFLKMEVRESLKIKQCQMKVVLYRFYLKVASFSGLNTLIESRRHLRSAQPMTSRSICIPTATNDNRRGCCYLNGHTKGFDQWT